MRLATVTVVTLALAAIAGVGAQAPAFKRTVLQQGDISVPGREAVMAVAEFQPGASPGRHSHPGEEVGYVLEGRVVVEQQGKPAVTLNAGQTFLIPAGAIHRRKGKAPGHTRCDEVAGSTKPLRFTFSASARPRPGLFS